MEDSQYKLIYFNIRGFGECIKYIFAYKNVEYDLETIPLDENWSGQKPLFPFGQLPVLEVNGKRLCQSLAICHYLGSKYDLLHGDVWEDSQLLAIGCSLQDIILRVARFYYERDPTVRNKLKSQFIGKLLPFYLDKYNNIVKNHKDFVCGKLTWLDFYMVASLEFINGMMEEDWVTGKYSELEALMEKIKKLPGVQDYILTRPDYKR